MSDICMLRPSNNIAFIPDKAILQMIIDPFTYLQHVNIFSFCILPEPLPADCN